jgi:hypothetical protein
MALHPIVAVALDALGDPPRLDDPGRARIVEEFLRAVADGSAPACVASLRVLAQVMDERGARATAVQLHGVTAALATMASAALAPIATTADVDTAAIRRLLDTGAPRVAPPAAPAAGGRGVLARLATLKDEEPG